MITHNVIYGLLRFRKEDFTQRGSLPLDKALSILAKRKTSQPRRETDQTDFQGTCRPVASENFLDTRSKDQLQVTCTRPSALLRQVDPPTLNDPYALAEQVLSDPSLQIELQIERKSHAPWIRECGNWHHEVVQEEFALSGSFDQFGARGWKRIDYAFLMQQAGGLAFIAKTINGIYETDFTSHHLNEINPSSLIYMGRGQMNRIYGLIAHTKTDQSFPMVLRFAFDRSSSEDSCIGTETGERASALACAKQIFGQGDFSLAYHRLAEQLLVPKSGAFYYDPMRCRRFEEYLIGECKGSIDSREEGVPYSVMGVQWIPGKSAEDMYKLPNRWSNPQETERIQGLVFEANMRLLFSDRFYVEDNGDKNYTIISLGDNKQWAVLHDIDLCERLTLQEFPFVMERYLARNFSLAQSQWQLITKIAEEYTGNSIGQSFELSLIT